MRGSDWCTRRSRPTDRAVIAACRVESRRGRRQQSEGSAPCLEVGNPRSIATALTCLRRLGHRHTGASHPGASPGRIRNGLANSRRALDRKLDRSAADDRSGTAGRHAGVVGSSSPSLLHRTRLFCLVTIRMVKVSIQHGLTGRSAFGYVTWGLLLAGAFHRYGDGYRFAKLACDLVAKHGFIAVRRKFTSRPRWSPAGRSRLSIAIDFAAKGQSRSN